MQYQCTAILLENNRKYLSTDYQERRLRGA